MITSLGKRGMSFFLPLMMSFKFTFMVILSPFVVVLIIFILVFAALSVSPPALAIAWSTEGSSDLLKVISPGEFTAPETYIWMISSGGMLIWVSSGV